MRSSSNVTTISEISEGVPKAAEIAADRSQFVESLAGRFPEIRCGTTKRALDLGRGSVAPGSAGAAGCNW